MNPERWQQVDHILQAVMECRPEERDTFLRNACGGDAGLEDEVRSLLSSDRAAGTFLHDPALEVAARASPAGDTESMEASLSLSGRTFSHYHVIEKLGAGGMGVVWRARDPRLDRFVALKFLPAAKMTDPDRKRRFAQEARTASALNHPHIVTIYDIDQASLEGRPADFIAMEY